jgi:phosphoribosyl 1,2-cyclic phosphate phosphodiesterase
MEILFLGTGTSTGVPQIACNCAVCTSQNEKDKRLRSSVLVTIDGVRILIDCGPDFRQQALTNHISKVDCILLTHEHYDHVSGLDEVRPMREADVFGEKRVLEAVVQNMPYIFRADPYPGAPEIRLNEITEEPFSIKGVDIIPVRMTHFNLPVFGYRIGNFAYLTDFSAVNGHETDKLKNLDVLVVDALRQFPHHGHLMLSEALELIEKLKPKKAFLTHISHDMGLHETVQPALPENVFLAYDNLKVIE